MYFMRDRLIPRRFGALPVLLWAGILLPLCLGAASAAEHEKVRVVVGQSITHDVPTVIKTISIADPEVVDVVVASPYQVLLTGRDIGFTTLVIWDENNVSSLYDVVVQSPFSDQQIELNVKVAEINRSRAFELGSDLLFRDGEKTIGSFGGEVATPRIPFDIFNGGSTEGVGVAFRYITGGDEFSGIFHALQEDGILRVLAEPTVVAASGKNASFLSGGELPIPVATSGVQGGTTVTIEWREFGIKVNFLPTIVDEGIINLAVAPEVSSLDFTNGITLSGFEVPSLRTRRAQTTVELRDGEVLVIGGLILEEETRVRRKIPLLGHIPLLGYFFSNTQTLRNKSELLLVVSPRIISALPRGTVVPLPGAEEEDE